MLSVMLGSLQAAGEEELCRATVTSLTCCLAASQHWTRRQTFALLVAQLLAALPWEQVAVSLMPPLLDLAKDRVPNVRLKVAHVLGHVLPDGKQTSTSPSPLPSLPPSECYTDQSYPEYSRLTSTLTSLAADPDPDVREAACLGHRVEPAPPPRQAPPPDPVVSHQLAPSIEAREGMEEPLPTWAQIAEVIQEKI